MIGNVGVMRRAVLQDLPEHDQREYQTDNPEQHHDGREDIKRRLPAPTPIQPFLDIGRRFFAHHGLTSSAAGTRRTGRVR